MNLFKMNIFPGVWIIFLDFGIATLPESFPKDADGRKANLLMLIESKLRSMLEAREAGDLREEQLSCSLYTEHAPLFADDPRLLTAADDGKSMPLKHIPLSQLETKPVDSKVLAQTREVSSDAGQLGTLELCLRRNLELRAQQKYGVRETAKPCMGHTRDGIVNEAIGLSKGAGGGAGEAADGHVLTYDEVTFSYSPC